jgi:hypothetical protein
MNSVELPFPADGFLQFPNRKEALLPIREFLMHHF